MIDRNHALPIARQAELVAAVARQPLGRLNGLLALQGQSIRSESHFFHRSEVAGDESVFGGQGQDGESLLCQLAEVGAKGGDVFGRLAFERIAVAVGGDLADHGKINAHGPASGPSGRAAAGFGFRR